MYQLLKKYVYYIVIITSRRRPCINCSRSRCIILSSQHLAGDHVSTAQEVRVLYYHHNISQETMYQLLKKYVHYIIIRTSHRRPCINCSRSMCIILSSQHLAGDHVSTAQEVCALYYHQNISQETMYQLLKKYVHYIVITTSRRRPCINCSRSRCIILSSQHLAGDHVSTTQEVGALYYHQNISQETMYQLLKKQVHYIIIITSRRRPCINYSRSRCIILSSQHLTGDHVSTTQEVGALYYHHNISQETLYQLLKKQVHYIVIRTSRRRPCINCSRSRSIILSS